MYSYHGLLHVDEMHVDDSLDRRAVNCRAPPRPGTTSIPSAYRPAPKLVRADKIDLATCKGRQQEEKIKRHLRAGADKTSRRAGGMACPGVYCEAAR